MRDMGRREFMSRAAAMATATFVSGRAMANTPWTGTSLAGADGIRRACDTIVLGRSGVQTSRMALGTGSRGLRQSEMGQRGVLKLFRHALDHGVRWWDVADMYRIHTIIRATLRQIPRDQVVLTSKTRATDAAGARADIERFRKELGVDCIDILLLHCMTSADWPNTLRGAMDVLSEAKEKGIVRAVGCSCHDFGALKAAASEEWVDISMARINPFAVHTDVGTPDEIPQVVETLNATRQRGKAVYGMKILGEGRLDSDQIDESLRFTLKQDCMDGFVIGFRSIAEFDDLLARIERVQV